MKFHSDTLLIEPKKILQYERRNRKNQDVPNDDTKTFYAIPFGTQGGNIYHLFCRN